MVESMLILVNVEEGLCADGPPLQYHTHLGQSPRLQLYSTVLYPTIASIYGNLAHYVLSYPIA